MTGDQFDDDFDAVVAMLLVVCALAVAAMGLSACTHPNDAAPAARRGEYGRRP